MRFSFAVTLLIALSVRSSVAQNFWQPATPFYGRLAASAISVSSEGDVFAGGFDGNIYRSQDEGNSWTKLNLDSPTYGPIGSIAINSEGDIFVVISSGHVLRSADNGQTWLRVYSPRLRSRGYGASLIWSIRKRLLSLEVGWVMVKPQHRPSVPSSMASLG